MFASISVNKLFVLSMAMRNHHSVKRHRHVKAHVKLILGNDELMFKRVAACTIQAFSLKFVASLAETFTRHARKIAEGLRGPSIRRIKKKEADRERDSRRKNNRPREDKGRQRHAPVCEPAHVRCNCTTPIFPRTKLHS